MVKDEEVLLKCKLDDLLLRSNIRNITVLKNERVKKSFHCCKMEAKNGNMPSTKK
jgi:hypothetical protein